MFLTNRVGSFLGREDILAGPRFLKGLFEGSGSNEVWVGVRRGV